MRWCWVFWAFWIAGLLAGCDGAAGGAVAETDEKHFQRGQRLLREGRDGEALASFLKVIEKRPDAAESHLEAGILYQQHIGDPIASIYHLRRFCELAPDSREAEKARQLIESAKKDFARQLPGQPFDAAIDRIDLLEMLEAVRQENEQLKRRLAEASSGAIADRVRAPAPPPSERAASSAASPRPAGAADSATRYYEVAPGDTLTRISTKVYGESARWQDIFEANRDVLPNPHAVKPGQLLRIPE